MLTSKQEMTNQDSQKSLKQQTKTSVSLSVPSRHSSLKSSWNIICKEKELLSSGYSNVTSLPELEGCDLVYFV